MGFGELRAKPLDAGAGLSSSELLLELPPILSGDRCRVNEDQFARRRSRLIASSLRRIEQGKQSSPGIADDDRVDELKFPDHGDEIPNLCPPGYRVAIGRLRTATAALVVEYQPASTSDFGEREHLWEQVVVMRAGTAVQHQQLMRAGRAVLGPIERLLSETREAVRSMGRYG